MPEVTIQKPASRIDSHQHFWNYNPARDAWITDEMKVIQCDFLPEHLSLILEQNRINGCVSVQADQSEAETEFLLGLADKYDFIKGVVGWVDLRAKNLEERLNHYSQFKKLKGFRHIVQAESDGFLLTPEFSKGVDVLRSFGFTYDILIYPNQLLDAIAFVKDHADQPLVMDHLAKPYIRDREIKTWAAYIKQLAQFPNLYCKLSGMVTEADWASWKQKDFEPYIDVVLKNFGADRVMYGSDWPVCLVAARYDQQLGILEQCIEALTTSEKQKIMGENATRFYNL
jgi:L-fuconolactonase